MSGNLKHSDIGLKRLKEARRARILLQQPASLQTTLLQKVFHHLCQIWAAVKATTSYSALSRK